MTFGEFKVLVETTKQRHKVWFALERDRVATDLEIQWAESQLRTKLQGHYRSFLKEYGGGLFALCKIYSLQKDSEWNLVEINRREGLIGTGFVAISDNGAGDLYGFKSDDGSCGPEIWFHDHETGDWQKTEFSDLLSFLERKALSN